MTRFLLLLTLLATTTHAQSQTIHCVAADHPTQWPTHFGSGSGRKYVPAPNALVVLLSGTYDIDLVTTEGVATPEVSRWRIVIVPVDTSLWPSSGFGLQRRRPLFVGTRTDMARPTPLDSLRRGRFLGGLSDFEMGVDSSIGSLHWRTDPGAMDSGWFFTVAATWQQFKWETIRRAPWQRDRPAEQLLEGPPEQDRGLGEEGAGAARDHVGARPCGRLRAHGFPPEMFALHGGDKGGRRSHRPSECFISPPRGVTPTGPTRRAGASSPPG